MEKKIRLADYLTKAVAEIVEAHRRALDRGVPFLGFEECEVECALESKLGPNGEVNILAVKIGASAEQTVAHKVRLVYKPFDPQRHLLQAASIKGMHEGRQGPVPSSERTAKKVAKDAKPSKT